MCIRDSCTGAIAYFQSRRHTDWLRRMLIICVLCAVVPVLGAMFQLFNLSLIHI